MGEAAIGLGYGDVALAAGLVLIAGLVSAALRLGLERSLALGVVRSIVQLLLLGWILRWVFGLDQLVAVLGMMLTMTAIASRAAVKRSSRTVPGASLMAFAALFLSGLSTTFVGTAVIVGVEPAWRAQYAIPLLGMVLGNGLTGLSLGMDHLLEALSDRRAEVEQALALGATRWEAARRPIAQAVRRALIPIVNAMMVVGLVSIPGMMTGQVLQGADPVSAVKYQLVILFMIAGSVALSAIITALLLFARLTNDRHQLRWERIIRR